MPDAPDSPPVPAGHPFRKRKKSTDGFYRGFFGANAGLTIVILVLIIVFLFREGAGFFPAYRKELSLYRRAGLEFVDLARTDLTAHEQMRSLLNRAYFGQVNAAAKSEFLRSQEAAALVAYFNDAVAPAQSALQRVQEDSADGTVPQELQESLTAKYRALLADSTVERPGRVIPTTPHLTEEERKGIVDALAARDPLSTDDPPLIETLQQELAAKQAGAATPFKDFRAAIDAFAASSKDLNTLITDSGKAVKASEEAERLHEVELDKKEAMLAAAKKAKTAEERARFEQEAASAVTTQDVDVNAALQPVLAKLPEFAAANATISQALETVLQQLPASLEDEKAARYLSAFKKAAPDFAKELADTTPAMQAWKADKPVGLFSAVGSFITGKKWITGGSWQDFYGIVPLFVGSLIIAAIALTLAIPLGVGAAVYTNQLAGPRQQKFIKPTIEFLQAIPSVVLGFIGIAVVGTWLQETSAHDAFSWLPGFPIQARLNMFTAGCLLGLMAIPTIFTLSEDALNNVPAAFAEASDALGASKLQTVFRVVVPAAVSGILAAVLLGLGRVIGETMVVLLVAGNRIAIPDFTEGLGMFFQPSHTLTGIIAQELGEVPAGSVHYRALFVVGLLLFFIVLSINWIAQRLIHRFRIGQH